VALLAEGDVVAIELLLSELLHENELLQFIKEEVTGGRRIFALHDLTDYND